MTSIASTLSLKLSKKENKRKSKEPHPFTHFSRISFEIAMDLHFSVFSWEGEYSCDNCQFDHVSILVDAADEQFPKSVFFLKTENFF